MNARTCAATAAAVLAVASVTGLVPVAAGGPAAPQGVQSLLESRTRNVVMQEWDLSCGAAALATVLRYQHGETVTEREVALGLIDRPEYFDNPDLIRARQGFSLLDMKRYATRLGYEGIGLGRLRFEDLLERAPVIVPVHLQGFPHFVVFRGASESRVLLADPAFGNVTLTRSRFEAAWLAYGDAGRVGFVVHGDRGQAPPAELAPTAREFVMFR